METMRPMPLVGQLPGGEPVYFAGEGFDNPGLHIWDGKTHVRYVPATTEAHTALRIEIESAVNRHSAENGSDTPDFILAQYLVDSLRIFDTAVTAREKWYGRPAGEGAAINGPAPVPMPEDSHVENLHRDESARAERGFAPGSRASDAEVRRELDDLFPVVSEHQVGGHEDDDPPFD